MGKTKQIVLGDEAQEKANKEKAAQKREQKKAQKESSKEEVVVAPVEKKAEKKQKNIVRKAHGKKYNSAVMKMDKKKAYSIEDAVKLIKEMKMEKFNASVELHINTIDTEAKGEVTLPHGTGKEVNVVVFNAEVEEAIGKGQLNFDVLLARPEDMKALVKYARVLGPKGLMPSPKKGTVTSDMEAAKKKFTGGNVMYKTEPKFPIMHQVIGKTEFTEKQLVENITVFLKAVQKKNMKNAYLKSSMSPSLMLNISEFV